MPLPNSFLGWSRSRLRIRPASDFVQCSPVELHRTLRLAIFQRRTSSSPICEMPETLFGFSLSDINGSTMSDSNVRFGNDDSVCRRRRTGVAAKETISLPLRTLIAVCDAHRQRPYNFLEFA